jgi:hypothetical protein
MAKAKGVTLGNPHIETARSHAICVGPSRRQYPMVLFSFGAAFWAMVRQES